MLAEIQTEHLSNTNQKRYTLGHVYQLPCVTYATLAIAHMNSEEEGCHRTIFGNEVTNVRILRTQKMP